MAKKTQAELLQEIVELLTPVANLAKFNIGQINAQLAAQEAAQEAASKEAPADEIKLEKA